MDHEMSIKTQAAERYLLGELPPGEREAFEQHYFDCSECADHVRLAFQLGENARAVFAEEARRPTQERASGFSNWLAWFRPVFLVPATACLVAFMVYQNAAQIPALRARVTLVEKPLVVSSVLLAPSARAAVPTVAVAKRAPFFQLSLAVGAVRSADRFEFVLRSDSGKMLWTLPVSRVEPDSNVTLLIPTAGVPDGYYDSVLVAITGNHAADLDHYRFAVRRQ